MNGKWTNLSLVGAALKNAARASKAQSSFPLTSWPVTLSLLTSKNFFVSVTQLKRTNRTADGKNINSPHLKPPLSMLLMTRKRRLLHGFGFFSKGSKRRQVKRTSKKKKDKIEGLCVGKVMPLVACTVSELGTNPDGSVSLLHPAFEGSPMKKSH